MPGRPLRAAKKQQAQKVAKQRQRREGRGGGNGCWRNHGSLHKANFGHLQPWKSELSANHFVVTMLF